VAPQQSRHQQQPRRLRVATTSKPCLLSALRMSSSASSTVEAEPEKVKPVVQYIVLRRDLDWPAGAMAAQAAHASVAAIAQALQVNDEATQTYISPSNLPHMTKYVYGVDSLEQLEQVRDAWNSQVVVPILDKEGSEQLRPSYCWVEQPENIPSAFATWPVERTNKVSKVVKNMKLTYF